MHNVADKDVFRPVAWNAFGMDKEGADYRACQNFGPMYIKKRSSLCYIWCINCKEQIRDKSAIMPNFAAWK